MLGIDRDTIDATLTQRVHGAAQPGLALDDALGDDRLHDVELELSCLGGNHHGGVVANHLEASLVGHLGDDRVYLARHDAGAWSHRREVDLVETATGTRGHEAEVVADLGQLHGQALQRAAIAHVVARVGSSLDEVLAEGEVLARQLGQFLSAELSVARDGVEARTDGRGAHVDLEHQLHIAIEVADLLLKGIGEGRKLLSARHGDGVLQLCAAHLDVVLELLALLAERGHKTLQSGYELLVHLDEGEADGGGIDVVGGLTAVAVVVGPAVLVVALFVAHQLEGTVGNHLVGVHVDRRAGTTLHHVGDEVLMKLAVDDLAAGAAHSVGHVVRKLTQLVVGLGSSELHVCNGLDILGIVAHVLARNLVIVDGALSLHTIVSLGGYLELTQEVALYTKLLLVLVSHFDFCF